MKRLFVISTVRKGWWWGLDSEKILVFVLLFIFISTPINVSPHLELPPFLPQEIVYHKIEKNGSALDMQMNGLFSNAVVLEDGK